MKKGDYIFYGEPSLSSLYQIVKVNKKASKQDDTIFLVRPVIPEEDVSYYIAESQATKVTKHGLSICSLELYRQSVKLRKIKEQVV